MFKHQKALKRLYLTLLYTLCSLSLVACVSREETISKTVDGSAAINQIRGKKNFETRLNLKTELAKSYINSRQYDAAISTLDELLAENDAIADLLHLKAVALMAKQDPSSIVFFQKALNGDSKNPHIMNNYAWALCKQQRLNEGLAMLNQASDLADAYLYPKLLANRGICHVLVNKLPSIENKRVANVTLNQAERLNHLQVALLDLNKSLTILPNYTPALMYKAYALIQLQNHQSDANDEAEKIMQSFAVSQMNDPELLWLGYQIWLKLGNPISAKLWAEWLVEKHPYSFETKQYQRSL